MKSNHELIKAFSDLFQENIEERNLLEIDLERITDMLEEDSIGLTLYLFFFPTENTKEQNLKDKFWFEKYNASDKYSEYKFAVDLINTYSSYKKDKSKEKFNFNIKKLVDKFEDYKMISSFVELVKERADLFEFIVSYLIQDKDYFVSFFKFNHKSIPDDIHNQSFYDKLEIKLQKLKIEDLIQKMEEYDKKLKNKSIQHDKKINELNTENDKKINELNSKITELKKNFAELSKRMDKIELRDTIKMSYRYLYNVLYYRLTPEKEYKKKFREKLSEIKKILSESKFRRFKYLLDFINDIEFEVVNQLNSEAHSENKHRKIENISKYLQSSCKANLQMVVDFFKSMPNINDFIDLNILYYHNPQKAENEFKKKMIMMKYVKIYLKTKNDCDLFFFVIILFHC